jgi:hypothetical protein
MFELGDVRELSLADVARHATVRAIAAASLLDAQPLCADAWHKPFSGVSPVRTFLSQGDLFGQRPRCLQWQQQASVASRIFELLAAGDEGANVVQTWAALQRVGDQRVALQAP